MESLTPLSAERLELGALWQQLCQVNSAIQDLKSQSFDIWSQSIGVMAFAAGDVEDFPTSIQEFLDAQHAKLRGTVGTLEHLRDSIRAMINTRVRPTLRSLNILDLPDELLIRIFDYANGGSYEDDELFFFTLSSANVENVKNLRLTCHRFCDTSSHRLLRYIKVDMTQPSVAHLEKISLHPLISKGIRAVLVNFCYYDSVLAGSLRDFATYESSNLRDRVQGWHFMMTTAFDWDTTSKVTYENAIARALSLAESWEEIAIDDGTTKEDRADHILLQKAHSKYKQCYENQEVLRRGTLARSVASAMARMHATWLELHDHDVNLQVSDIRDSALSPEDMLDDELMLGKLIAPIKSWEDARDLGLGPPPAEVIPKLLSSIYEEDAKLTGLKIWTPPPEDLSLLLPDETEKTNVKAAMKHLKALDINPRDIYTEDNFWAFKKPDEWKPYFQFLSILLSSTAIQSLSLNLDTLSASTSMGCICSLHTWPHLERLEFNGPFHLLELQDVVQRAKKKLNLKWSGDLMSGSWAEILDFLKERVSEGGLSYHSEIGAMNGRPLGAECDQMSDKERDFIFSTRTGRPNLATGYILGFPKTNPLKQWALGELIVEEEE